MKNNASPFSKLPAGRRLSGRGWLLMLALLAPGLALQATSIVNSVHNLSANGPGTFKANSEADVCIFCHTVHQASGVTPLWNHSMSSISNYVVYSSARLDSLGVTVPQPNGSSRLCLSCHDGTVALGEVGNGGPITMQGGNDKLTGVNNLGTDLSADHPISFDYDATLFSKDSEIKDPTLPEVKARLDHKSRVQCTSCHDAHNNANGNFLVMPNTGSALCLTCHNPGSWSSSAHALSSAVVPAAITGRLATRATARTAAVTQVSSMSMAAVGCENCHANHQSGTKQHLLQNATLEQNCLVCHNGLTAKKNVAADFQKASIHPITLNSESHKPTEDPVNPPGRHVVCADCHNAHASSTATAVAPNVSGAIRQVTGVAAAGGVVKPATREYELCFRCHADSVGRGPATVSRQFPQTNTRLQFSAGNRSFHPVTAVGKNPAGVPSLISPWTTSSLTYCTDCHNSDSATKAGGNGANGPHGSIYSPILERNLVVTDQQSESAAAYALCYKCHSRTSILANQSFPFHRIHVVDKQTACTTCHDSHGVANAPHLINFNTTYVTPSSNGRLEYLSTGQYKGTCSLTCHGADHKAKGY